MKRMLNREILAKVYHIHSVDRDGHYLLKEVKSYDFVTYVLQIKEDDKTVTCKHKFTEDVKYKVWPLYNYETKKIDTLLVHNVVYAWYNDDYDVNMDIDHIDGNRMNNALENLQQVSRKFNLAKRTGFKNQYDAIKHSN